MYSLTKGEIIRIVNRYIGVQGGYLGNFSYRTHAEFYPEYCELDVDPYRFEGTTRERFISILDSVTPDKQARIIRGVLERFPLNEENAPSTRTPELYNELLQLVRRLEGTSPVPSLEPVDTSLVVVRAITDAERLIETNDALGAVDRLHTALYGHLLHVCKRDSLPVADNSSITAVFKTLRTHHPALQDIGPREQDIQRIMNSLATIIDALNPIRNHASIAHPNDELLGQNEAKLVVNSVKTLFHYLEAKLRVYSGKVQQDDDIPF